MEEFLILLKKIIPRKIFVFLQPFYHKFLSKLSAFWYAYPSEKMIVIGVTGTNGKSTTVHLIARILEAQGDKTGETSTTIFKIGDKEWLNDKKMTMLGRFALQKMLKKMFMAGCKYAVVETSSEGIKQFRHLGVNYDILVFTNLTPEHIESHGGFENYKKAKLKLFKHLEKSKHKTINNRKILKTIIVNLDDKYAGEFLNFNVDKKIGVTLRDKKSDLVDEVLRVEELKEEKDKTVFKYKNKKIKINLLGKFNVYNSALAMAVAIQEKFSLKDIKEKLEEIKKMPGRMEKIEEGQNFKIIIDYAPEPKSLQKAYEVIKKIQNNRIIHILGSCGGGRDKARQPILGKIAGEKADYVIVTNEDPYDDDPMEIINNVAKGAEEKDKELNKNLFKILDRRKAINKALSLAKKNDIVFITGKGSEQAMCLANGKKIPWDDRKVVREELKKKEENK